jgi:alpha-tubulin suppressor-like RCC1 family protein
VQVPTRIAQELFCDKTRCRIKKIVSGAQHTVALTDCKKVYAWGDAESGKIGRELKTRYKNKQSLKIEKTNAKNAKDVFCGRFHSFYVNDANQVFAWGMNNHGQLGLGHKNSIANAQRIRYLDPHEGDHVI